MIRTKLMEHQRQIVDFIKNKKYFGIFADYGLGKTLCALAYINLYKFRKILIVSTKTSIESTWPDEIKRHTDFQYVILTGTRKHKLSQLYFGLRKSMISSSPYHSEKQNITLFLINFDGVKNIFDELIQADFDFIVVDEATKIKSPKTDRTKALWKLGSYISRRCIMTGFPVTENINNLYSQIKFIDKGASFGQSYYGFMHTYFNKVAFNYYPRKNAIHEILNKIKPYCIRVEGSVIKLPPKVYKQINIEPTEQQVHIFKELNDYFRLEFGKVKIDTQYIFALINKSLQVCDGFIQDNNKNIEAIDTDKDNALIDIIDDIDVYKNKLLIWTIFRFSLNKISKLLSKLGIKHVTLHGGTDNVNKTVSEFQHGKTNVMVAIQKKASASITLSNCKYAVYYSNMWSADERLNSEARIRRRGSEHHDSIVYTDLVIKDSVENKVINCLKKKKSLIDDLKNQFGAISV